MKQKRLNDVFSSWIDGGIFTTLNALGVPWSDTAETLNAAYHGGHSGGKLISPLVSNVMGDSDTLTPEQITRLANIALSMYGTNWGKLWATLSLNYNPITNYDMTESETVSGESEGTSIQTESENGSSTQTNTATNNNAIFGFNSSDGVNSDRQTGNATETTSDERTDETSNSNTATHSETRTLTRSGNIGVTTSQQMIQAERDLWEWFFFGVVFKDLDNILCLSIY